MILEIERAWHQTPGWFGTLREEEQAHLLAWWNVMHAPPPSTNPTAPAPKGRGPRGP